MKFPFRRSQPGYAPTTTAQQRVDAAPEGLFEKCIACRELVYVKELERNWKVCPKCDYHNRMSSCERIALLLDEGTFVEMDAELRSVDFLGFRYVDKESKQEIGYGQRLLAEQKRRGLPEGAVSGCGDIDGRRVALVVMDLSFLGASVGSVIGEKVTRAIEHATRDRLPLLIVSASGGMRMQEGLMALMQMARTSAALTRLSRVGSPFISIMTDQTYGGVSASWGALGDVIIAEPGTKIGFAGPRVIEQTIRQKLPSDAQTAVFQLNHGMIDMVVHRGQLRETVVTVLGHLASASYSAETAHGASSLVAH